MILAVDRSNFSNILRVTSDQSFHNKVKLMRDFDPVSPGGEVPDPYFGGSGGFQEVFDILDRSCEKLLDEFSN
jgi:protein-tyrosine phosphatase